MMITRAATILAISLLAAVGHRALAAAVTPTDTLKSFVSCVQNTSTGSKHAFLFRETDASGNLQFRVETHLYSKVTGSIWYESFVVEPDYRSGSAFTYNRADGRMVLSLKASAWDPAKRLLKLETIAVVESPKENFNCRIASTAPGSVYAEELNKKLAWQKHMTVGQIDGFETAANGSTYLVGSACSLNSAQPVDVQIFVGGPSEKDPMTLLETVATTAPFSTCVSYPSDRGIFRLPLDTFFSDPFKGRYLYAYAISREKPVLDNLALQKSGTLWLPYRP